MSATFKYKRADSIIDISEFAEFIDMQQELITRLSGKLAVRLEEVFKTAFFNKTGDILTDENAHRVTVGIMPDGHRQYFFDGVLALTMSSTDVNVKSSDIGNHKIVASLNIKYS